MVLSGKEIQRQIGAGRISVSPFNPSQINPASLDLRLGYEIAVYSDVVELEDPNDDRGVSLRVKPDGFLDAARENPVRRFRIRDDGFLLKPGIGYLGHTSEIVSSEDFCPILDGKSSIGRLFVKIHETAGFGDPFFQGQYTLEITAVHPIWVYPRQRFSQIRFHEMAGEIEPYKGNYVGDLAKGAVPSRSWKQLAEDGIRGPKRR